MQLTERHMIKKTNGMFNRCEEICFASKNIYNRALYLIKQDWNDKKSHGVLNNLNEVMKKEDCFKEIPCNVAQQTVRMTQKIYKSYFALIKAKQKGKLPKEQIVRGPKYLNKKNGRFVAQYTTRVISKKHFNKRHVIKLSQIDIEVPTKIEKYEDIACVRVVPKNDIYYIEVVYNVPNVEQLESNDNYAAIDLGVNNLATVTFNKKGENPIIINGKQVKSINRYYNKKLAKLKRKLSERGKKKSRATRKLTNKRNNKVSDFLHKASRRIVNIMSEKDVRTLIIGKNDGWKQNVNIGDSNNQNFVEIPHSRFVDMLKYKCEQKGIKVILTEESYTSKASFLDLDDLPKYDGDDHTYVFSGYRVKRGLYKSKKQKCYINADVNGSYNILRKVFPTAFANGIEGIVVYPLIINVY